MSEKSRDATDVDSGRRGSVVSICTFVLVKQVKFGFTNQTLPRWVIEGEDKRHGPRRKKPQPLNDLLDFVCGAGVDCPAVRLWGGVARERERGEAREKDGEKF